MRTIELNGYIDEDEFWGDEITPEMLRDALYQDTGDVLLKINSYGGSCNAATRMYDIIREYPGNVDVRISGIAASAASVVALAGRRVEMSPGSIYMMHNPQTIAFGEERDLDIAKALLRATKDSIINIYHRKTGKARAALSDMMDATAWLDAEAALDAGFIDAITGDASSTTNRAQPRAPINREDAELAINAWAARRLTKPHPKTPPMLPEPADHAPASEQALPEPAPGVFVAHRYRLLEMQEV